MTTTNKDIKQLLEEIEIAWSLLDYSNSAVSMLQMAKMVGRMQGMLKTIEIELEVENNLKNKSLEGIAQPHIVPILNNK
jgi:type II secretory pathway component PulF